MPTTSYHTINGRIVGQTKDGVRTHYVPDALGSVVATLDANGTVENTYRYKPYGSLLAKTGTGEDPRFMWVGRWGYRSAAVSSLPVYVRARHVDPNRGQWTSKDPFWPLLPPYIVSLSRPTVLVDPSGRLPSIGGLRQSGSIGGAIGGSAMDSACNCCCKALALFLTASDPHDTPERMWHDLHLVAVTQNTIREKGEFGRKCKLIWREKTNEPYGHYTMPRDTWFNVNDIPNIAHTDYQSPQDCPSFPDVYHEFDDPSYLEPSKPTERKLCIRIELTDGCSGQMSVVTFAQLIIVTSAGRSIKGWLGSGGDLSNYCRYP